MISYRQLLDIFWASHDPTYRSSTRQYQAFVFYHNDAQKAAAEETRDALAVKLGKEIKTQIVPAGIFYQAEDYHQKYYLVYQPEVRTLLQSRYPNYADYIASTAVARLNGYAGGYITAESLVQELSSLGWSQEDIAQVIDAAGEDVAALCPAPD